MPDNLYEATGIKTGSRVKVTIKKTFECRGAMKLSVRHRTFEIGDEFEGTDASFLKRRQCVEVRTKDGTFPLPLDMIILERA